MSIFDSAAYISPTLLRDMRVATYRPRDDQPTAPPSIPLAINFIQKYHGGVGYTKSQNTAPIEPWKNDSQQERIHEMLGATEQLRGDKYNFKKRPNKPTLPSTPLSGNGAPSFPTATEFGAKKIKSLLNARSEQYEALRNQAPLPAPTAPILDENEADKFQLDLVIRSALDKITYGTVDKSLYGDIIKIIRLFFATAISMSSDDVVQFVSEMNDIAQTARVIKDDTGNKVAQRRFAKSILILTHTVALLAAEYGIKYADLPNIKEREFGLASLKKKVKFNKIGYLKPEDITRVDGDNVEEMFLNRREQPEPGSAIIQPAPLNVEPRGISEEERTQLRNSGFSDEEINGLTSDEIAAFMDLVEQHGDGRPRRQRRGRK